MRGAILASFLSLVLLAAPVRPASACDLALALAIDVSGSVDPREFGIQMDGLAAALRDGLVSEALVRAEAAVLVVQWTGSSRQAVSVNWTRTRTFEEVEALAAKVEAVTRKWRNFSTAIGEALEFTLAQFPLGPDCARRVIDVSGDGLSNEGVEPTSVHDRLAVENVVVNGLAIEGLGGDLTAYYFENVIRGEGAFVMTATGYLDYPETIRRKLIREVTRQIASVK